MKVYVVTEEHPGYSYLENGNPAYETSVIGVFQDKETAISSLSVYDNAYIVPSAEEMMHSVKDMTRPCTFSFSAKSGSVPEDDFTDTFYWDCIYIHICELEMGKIRGK